MNETPHSPFDSIEGTKEYVELMLEAIEETKAEVEADIAAARANGAARRAEGLILVSHKLDRLSHHIGTSRRILNDLRMLRRLLLRERTFPLDHKSAAAGSGG